MASIVPDNSSEEVRQETKKPSVVPNASKPSIPMTATKTEKTWQEELAKECRNRYLMPPVYNIVSDRRGGRTAWSSTVIIDGNANIAARYWYDGQYLNEAKEDAATVAVNALRAPGHNGS